MTSPEAWDAPRGKLKRPSEWVRRRWCARPASRSRSRALHGGQELLGEPLWRPPAPKGFPTTRRAWIDGLGRRLDIANNFAERVGGHGSIRRAIIEDVLGSLASAEAKQAVGRAESRQQALALLFMSPEFQRR